MASAEFEGLWNNGRAYRSVCRQGYEILVNPQRMPMVGKVVGASVYRDNPHGLFPVSSTFRDYGDGETDLAVQCPDCPIPVGCVIANIHRKIAEAGGDRVFSTHDEYSTWSWSLIRGNSFLFLPNPRNFPR